MVSGTWFNRCCQTHSGVWSLIGFIWWRTVAIVGGSLKRLNQAQTLLWQGQVDEAKALFTDCKRKQARNFCHYLDKHRHRIINYEYYQTEQICSIGSGAVESTVKQIDRRTKISGAQWKRENVPQVLAHRCAYLNGLLSVWIIKTGMLPIISDFRTRYLQCQLSTILFILSWYLKLLELFL